MNASKQTDHIDLSQFTCARARESAVREIQTLSELGPKTEVSGLARHVRFALRSRYRQPAPACPFGANNGLMHCSKTFLFSASL
jgi:hypothetical protein